MRNEKWIQYYPIGELINCLTSIASCLFTLSTHNIPNHQSQEETPGKVQKSCLHQKNLYSTRHHLFTVQSSSIYTLPSPPPPLFTPISYHNSTPRIGKSNYAHHTHPSPQSFHMYSPIPSQPHHFPPTQSS